MQFLNLITFICFRLQNFNAICLILLNPYSVWMQYSSCF